MARYALKYDFGSTTTLRYSPPEKGLVFSRIRPEIVTGGVNMGVKQ